MITKNSKIRLTITDIGIDGEGIGKYKDPSGEDQAGKNGLTFFVKNAVIGDEVLAVVTKMKKGYGYAKLLEILKASPDRVKPLCQLADRCGGCQIMQLSYAKQLEFKEEKVAGDIERIGGIRLKHNGQDGAEFLPIIGMMEFAPAHFRNKMQFPVGWDNNGHVVTGFYAGHTHYIVASSECPVSPEVDLTILEGIRSFLEKNRISSYNEESGRGLVRHILIRNGFHTGQIMICLVINGHSLDDGADRSLNKKNRIHSLDEAFVQEMKELRLSSSGCGEGFWKISSICLNVNTEKTNVILGREVIALDGSTYIEDLIRTEDGDLTFRISPLSFFQTNPKQTEQLYSKALEFAGLSGEETVWDLYCGTGTISLFLARKAQKVYGVEIIPEAITDARKNASRNGIENTEFICGRSEEVFVNAYASEDSGYPYPDVVVLDPPRKGCGPELMEAIMKVGPEKIVYVSCDPATLARDLKILCSQENSSEKLQHHYKLEKVQPVDMFPHTTHVETVVLLSRNMSK